MARKSLCRSVPRSKRAGISHRWTNWLLKSAARVRPGRRTPGTFARAAGQSQLPIKVLDRWGVVKVGMDPTYLSPAHRERTDDDHACREREHLVRIRLARNRDVINEPSACELINHVCSTFVPVSRHGDCGFVLAANSDKVPRRKRTPFGVRRDSAGEKLSRAGIAAIAGTCAGAFGGSCSDAVSCT